jgi:hypothetical protein
LPFMAVRRNDKRGEGEMKTCQLGLFYNHCGYRNETT